MPKEDEKKDEDTSSGASQEKNKEDEKKSDDTDSQASGKKNDQDDQDEDQPDYASELAALQSRLDQAEHTIVDLRQSKKGGSKKEKEEDDEKSEDEDVVDQKIAKGFSAIQQQIASTAIASTLSSLSSDPDERKLIMFHYQNSIKQTGISPDAILSDLENAKILANRRKILRENAEIKRAVVNKKTVSGGGRGSNQDKADVQDNGPELSEKEIALLARRGLKPSDVKK